MKGMLSYATPFGALHLHVPEQGMPEILAWAQSTGLAKKPTLRSSRINGMDDPPPSAILLPTGGAGFFGWPAIQGHRDGKDFTIQFLNWSQEQQDGALTRDPDDDF